jgi:Holliday junction DNA helicase RuvA
MIGRLRGELVAKQPPYLMLDVSGVGYELEAPMSTFYALPPVGETITLLTHLLIREDVHTLYAFSNEAERRLFRSLLRVSGIGAKMALAILSGMTSQNFSRCVQEGDVGSLVRLPGIGRKTAERLIVEMRDRLASEEIVELNDNRGTLDIGSRSPDAVDDAKRALAALGYKPAEASRMVNRVDTQDLSSEEIIREALKASLS